MQPRQTPGACVKALPCRAWGHPFYRPGLYASGTGTHLCTLRGALSSHMPQAGAVGLEEEFQSLASTAMASTTSKRMRYVAHPLLFPTPNSFHEARGMEAVRLEIQLCFESILMGLVYWSRLNNFPQKLLTGSIQGSMVHPSSGGIPPSLIP